MSVQGFLGDLKISTDGGTVWNTIATVRDVNIDISASEIDDSSRAGGQWGGDVPGQKKASIDFEMLHDAANTQYGVLKDACLAGTEVMLWALDASGGTGLQAYYYITSMKGSQPLDGRQVDSFTAKLNPATAAPSFEADV